MPGAHQLPARVVAGAHQFPRGLGLLIGHRDRGHLTYRQQLGQVQRVFVVGFHPIPRRAQQP
jgi:hypothetical protein